MYYQRCLTSTASQSAQSAARPSLLTITGQPQTCAAQLTYASARWERVVSLSFEIEPTADSFAIIGQAVAAGRSMWQDGRKFAKAGVVLLDLQAQADAPRDLLPTVDPIRSEKLMTALDAVNARFGRGTLRPGGIRQVTPWSTRANNRSPRYTTRFSDLM